MCSTVCSVAWGQTTSTPSSGAQSGSQQSMPGMDMSGHDMSNMQMKAMPMGDKGSDRDTTAHVMKSMVMAFICMFGPMSMCPSMDFITCALVSLSASLSPMGMAFICMFDMSWPDMSMPGI